MSIENRIEAFEQLGSLLIDVAKNTNQEIQQNSKLNELNQLVTDAPHYNGWFIQDNVRHMLLSIGESLTKSNLEKWIKPYQEKLLIDKKPKTIGVVMAGNVPLVGFHDFLSILISGNKILAKLSSGDNKLLPLIAELLIGINPEFKHVIEFSDARLSGFDGIIATGSNNTSRYFDYYFGKYPNIIRKNRNSIALLTGNETNDELQRLSSDIFMYYGLGCRNVSHIIIPKGYDFINLLKILSQDQKVISNHKYFNNYEYNKAIYLVNSTKHFDAGNLLLVEDSNYSTPVSVISYEYYDNIDGVS